LRRRPTNIFQYLFAQNIGIAFTGFATLDDLRGDGLFNVIVTVSDPQGETDKLECDTQDALGLRVEAYDRTGLTKAGREMMSSSMRPPRPPPPRPPTPPPPPPPP
jgi:hypothetical protein